MDVHFKTTETLRSAYMPFIMHGAIFVQSSEPAEAGSLLPLSIRLLDDEEVLDIDGKVVWVTHPGAQGDYPAGMGLQFTGENMNLVRKKIDTHLAGLTDSDDPTDTL